MKKIEVVSKIINAVSSLEDILRIAKAFISALETFINELNSKNKDND
ncbi:MAG: hypothetical protein QM751_06150 [Paludibacteraceae bacterium]